jgi:hypothetical protein
MTLNDALNKLARFYPVGPNTQYDEINAAFVAVGEAIRIGNPADKSAETSWLIERRDLPNGPHWCYVLCGGFDWINDSTKAIRFCRRDDANQVAEIFDDLDIHITEHVWPPPTLKEGTHER